MELAIISSNVLDESFAVVAKKAISSGYFIVGFIVVLTEFLN